MADFAVLASGSGTNFLALAQRVGLPHTLSALITDNARAYALVRAEELGIPSTVINYRAGRDQAQDRLLALLEELDPDLIALAGFMKILPASIVDRFQGRILNIHPSILPAYPGTRAIERSYADPEAAMGITIHLVDRGVDTGPVLAQIPAERSASESLEEVSARIHALEHEHYPRVVRERLDVIDREGRDALEALA